MLHGTAASLKGKPGMSYDDYIDLVENRYFGNVCRGDFDAILDCFTEDCRVLIYHGDKQPRHFSRDGSHGEPLRNFYEHLFGNFHPAFDDFRHYIDVPAKRCASTFLVTLEPRSGSAYAPHGTQQLNNCNFFDIRDDRVENMIIYYANPRAASAATPTGYPGSGG